MTAFGRKSQENASEIDTTTKKDRLSKSLTTRELKDIDLVFKQFNLLIDTEHGRSLHFDFRIN